MADDDWETRDGRVIPIAEMFVQHISSAHAKLGRWLKSESDPKQRRDLNRWRKRFRRELAKRQREYLAKRGEGKCSSE
jgi:hypothetical protein